MGLMLCEQVIWLFHLSSFSLSLMQRNGCGSTYIIQLTPTFPCFTHYPVCLLMLSPFSYCNMYWQTPLLAAASIGLQTWLKKANTICSVWNCIRKWLSDLIKLSKGPRLRWSNILRIKSSCYECPSSHRAHADGSDRFQWTCKTDIDEGACHING